MKEDCLLCLLAHPLGFYSDLICQLSVCILFRGFPSEGEVIVCQLAVTGGNTLVKADDSQ